MPVRGGAGRGAHAGRRGDIAALHEAAADRHLPWGVLQFLVERDGPANNVRRRDDNQRLPLFLAALAGAHEHARILLQAWPASVRERNQHGSTALHMAVAGELTSDATPSEVVPTARVLLDMWPEAAHDRGGAGGCTPLHQAVEAFERGGPQLVRLLAERGPQSLHTPDGQGRLPLHVATFLESARVLLELYPEATRVADHEGCLPAHTVIVGVAHKAAAPPCSLPTIVLEDTDHPPPPPGE
jgi:Ankyrin repeats (3 copies)